MSKEYNAGNIQVLEGLEAVRKRPAMYIGSTDTHGLHHLVYEIVDNSIDEALAGYCNSIIVTINADNSIEVEDNGRGIPIDPHPVYKKSALEIVLTKLHAGGKFDNDSYKVSGGLHGVGVSVVNALSEFMSVVVNLNGKKYTQEYKRGIPAFDVKMIGQSKTNGTTVVFRPDPQIFDTLEYTYDILAKRLRELAFLNAGITVTLRDKRGKGKENIFHFEGGIVSFVEHLVENKDPILIYSS